MMDKDKNSSHQIETLILAAGNYIRPSDDLRPRTIEAAKDAVATKAIFKKVQAFAIAGLLLMAISVPVVDRLAQYHASIFAPMPREMERQANELAADSRVGSNFGLSEAFIRLKQVQAERLGQQPLAKPQLHSSILPTNHP